MNQNNSVVATYPSHAATEAAIKKLQQSGFDMKKLSIVGCDYHTGEHEDGYYTEGGRTKRGGEIGAFGCGLWGLVLYSLGVHKDRLLQYETAIKTGKLILIANGSIEVTTHAKEILNCTKPETLEDLQ